MNVQQDVDSVCLHPVSLQDCEGVNVGMCKCAGGCRLCVAMSVQDCAEACCSV